MIGIFQGSPEGRANKCQRRAKGGLPRATSKKQGKSKAWQGALPKAGHGRAPCQKQGSLAAMIMCTRHLPRQVQSFKATAL